MQLKFLIAGGVIALAVAYLVTMEVQGQPSTSSA
jgi:hypothetical protein